MLKSHSTVSRRSFMKMIGLTATGIGAANMIAPSFHDLDELVSSGPAYSKVHPWWVKERSIKNPSFEIDWQIKKRNSQTIHAFDRMSHQRVVGKQEFDLRYKDNSERTALWIKQNRPGYSLRDRTLQTAASFGHVLWEMEGYFVFPEGKRGAVDWGGAVWKGTPEENLRMLRAALRVYGGRDLGVIPLDQDTQKLIWRVEDDYIPYVFENVPKGYQTGPIYKTASSMVAHRFDHYQANSPETDYCDMKEKRVIPNSKQMYIVTWTSQESPELHKHGSSPAGGSSFYVAYGDGREQTNRLQAFITGLGYEALASVMYNQLTNNTITNILAGNLELSRMAVTGLSPVFGSAIRGWSLITDLPLAPTHPIDAGIFRFCKTCGICAKNCPSESLSQDTEPTWDAPPQEYHKAGNKVFWWDGFKCFGWWLHGASACYLCNGVCPFTNRGEASIHDLVKFASATTPILNGFFASMDEVFDMTYRKKNYLGSDLLGDGAKGQPSVWDIEIPEKGYNSSRNVPGW